MKKTPKRPTQEKEDTVPSRSKRSRPCIHTTRLTSCYSPNNNKGFTPQADAQVVKPNCNQFLMMCFRHLGKQQVYWQIAPWRSRQHDFNLLFVIACTIENRLLARSYLSKGIDRYNRSIHHSISRVLTPRGLNEIRVSELRDPMLFYTGHQSYPCCA